jgi:hypothetical protein
MNEALDDWLPPLRVTVSAKFPDWTRSAAGMFATICEGP